MDSSLVLWTELGLDLHDATENEKEERAQLKRSVTHLLALLASEVSCDCVIIRTEDHDAQHLILQGYALNEKFKDRAIRPPETKAISLWDGDPFRGLTFRDYDGLAHTLVRKVDQEPQVEQFLRLVSTRVSFPLSLSDAARGLAVCVCFYDSQSSGLPIDGATQVWLLSQLHADRFDASKSLINSACHLPLLEFIPQDKRRRLVLRLLTTAHGMCWNRAWWFRSDAGRVRCVDCIGGTSGEEWDFALRDSEPHDTLIDELAFEAVIGSSRTDSLSRICVDTIFQLEELNAEEALSNADNEVWHAVPVKLAFDFPSRWNNYMDNLCSQNSLQYLGDLHLYRIHIPVGDQIETIVLSGNCYSEEAELPSLIKTGALMSVVCDCLNEDIDNTAAETLKNTLVAFGEEIPSGYEFRKRCAAWRRKRFDNDGEYRNQVIERVSKLEMQRNDHDKEQRSEYGH